MSEPRELASDVRGEGPVLLLVHGFPLDRTLWRHQVDALADLRRVIAVDLRGHGESGDPSPGGYSMEGFADDVARTLDALGVDRADIGGLSMGGYVAFALWRRHRDRIRSLVFCCTRAAADTPDQRSGREKAVALVRERGLGALYETLGDMMFAPGASAEVREEVRAMFLRVPPEVAAADLLALRDRSDATPLLAGIDVPVLWIAGEDDRIMPFESAREAAAQFPGARFVAVPGAGHLAPLEQPEAVSAALRAFLEPLG